ncbi:hypothetical protein [Microbacterium trichothecenolyticum]|uniref:Signal peptidase I n=1 Tax=Microbacterium trichothecenolyticum TaxID=69370 RepID=A0A0M2HMD1_MICTR|nr:hypothetical protein [Microbacterium trichothecenolyticum]KJL45608.1 hypothetical protein RS82_00160 [Microbacterium trichothecenolyticum]
MKKLLKRMGDAVFDVLPYVIVALFVIALILIVFGIRLFITGGDMGCAFANDPALCIAVKEGRP